MQVKDRGVQKRNSLTKSIKLAYIDLYSTHVYVHHVTEILFVDHLIRTMSSIWYLPVSIYRVSKTRALDIIVQ